MKRLWIKFIFFVSLGFMLGICVPLIFIFLDVKELGMTFDFNNAREIAKSQLIYPFSFIVFPFLFSSTALLFGLVQSERDRSRKYSEYVASILNAISDPVLVCDGSGKILDSNMGFKNLFPSGLNTIDDIQQGLFECFSSQNFIQELCLELSSGTRFFTLKRSTLNHGSDSSSVLAFIDITHIREQQKLIEEQKAKLHDAARLSALGEMASGFAHEINNPLMIISGHMTVMERAIKREQFEATKFLEKIEVVFKTIQRISHIIQALRNLARNTEVTNFSEIAIDKVVEDIISLSKMKLSGKNVDFICKLNGLDKKLIRCDVVQLGQVFINLINNAVDAIESMPSAWIHFEVEEIADSYIFSVTDCGSGIDETVAKKIFEPMFTTKPVGKGTGLGLSLSKSIIEKHRGQLELDRSSKHTRFVVRLPKYEL